MMSKIDPSLLVQELDLSKDALKLIHPINLVLSGKSQSGKSRWMLDLVKYRSQMFDVTFSRIIYCSPHNSLHLNSYFEELKKAYSNIEFVTGLPSLKKLQLEHNTTPVLILCDDLMNSLLNSPEMVEFATQFIHHNSLSLCCSFQSYFCPSKFGKTFMRNAHYKVFFYNRLDQRELSLISSQIANCPKFFAENFQFLLDRFPNLPSYYLFIDGQHRSSTPHEFWCRTNIFPPNLGEEPKPIIFLKNPHYKAC